MTKIPAIWNKWGPIVSAVLTVIATIAGVAYLLGSKLPMLDSMQGTQVTIQQTLTAQHKDIQDMRYQVRRLVEIETEDQRQFAVLESRLRENEQGLVELRVKVASGRADTLSAYGIELQQLGMATIVEPGKSRRTYLGSERNAFANDFFEEIRRGRSVKVIATGDHWVEGEVDPEGNSCRGRGNACVTIEVSLAEGAEPLRIGAHFLPSGISFEQWLVSLGAARTAEMLARISQDSCDCGRNLAATGSGIDVDNRENSSVQDRARQAGRNPVALVTK